MTLVIEYLRILLVKLLFQRYWKLSTLTVISQSILETGSFGSGVYLQGNNLFGMKPSSRKIENGTFGNIEGSATYKNKWLSVWDYFKRQKQFNVSSDNYFEDTFRSGYAEDVNYISSWQRIIEKNKSKVTLIKNIIYGITVGFIFIFWRFFKKK